MIISRPELLMKLEKIKEIYNNLTEAGIVDYRIENAIEEIQEVRSHIERIQTKDYDPIFIDFEFATLMQQILEAYKNSYNLYLTLMKNNQLIKAQAVSNQFN